MSLKLWFKNNTGKFLVLLLVTIFFVAYNSLGEVKNPAMAVEPSKSGFMERDKDIILSFAGDVHGERPISPNLTADRKATEQIKKVFSQSDINFVNLETAITSNEKKREKLYNFKTNTSFLYGLKDLGVNLVSLANNHSYDYGKEGFIDTLNNLDSANIVYTGGGKSEKEAYSPRIVEIRGVKIAYLGFAKVNGGTGSIAIGDLPGTTDGYNERLVRKSILKAKEISDYVVVVVHWGEENSFTPRKREKDSAEKWLSYGADLIVGSHPHVIQPIVRVGNKEIAYSLGNFIFYSSKEANLKTGIYQVRLSSKGVFNGSDFIDMKINTKTGMPSFGN